MNAVSIARGVCGVGLVLVGLASAAPARAHCDTLDGPVVKDARKALAQGQVTPVLKWVRPQAEPEIRAAFRQALRTRRAGPAARHRADRRFFGTLVRVHRSGEGAGYTGLKPAGAVAPPVAAADRALVTGDVAPVLAHVGRDRAAGVRTRFDRALSTGKARDRSVALGRRYVAAYVDYVHYVEAAAGGADGHAAHGQGHEGHAPAHRGDAH